MLVYQQSYNSVCLQGPASIPRRMSGCPEIWISRPYPPVHTQVCNFQCNHIVSTYTTKLCEQQRHCLVVFKAITDDIIRVALSPYYPDNKVQCKSTRRSEKGKIKVARQWSLQSALNRVECIPDRNNIYANSRKATIG